MRVVVKNGAELLCDDIAPQCGVGLSAEQSFIETPTITPN
jgi:hypothetical protein